ncbi:MAG: hypothetical protein ACK4VV_02665 [Pseudomonas sp.]
MDAFARKTRWKQDGDIGRPASGVKQSNSRTNYDSLMFLLIKTVSGTRLQGHCLPCFGALHLKVAQQRHSNRCPWLLIATEGRHEIGVAYGV